MTAPWTLVLLALAPAFPAPEALAAAVPAPQEDRSAEFLKRWNEALATGDQQELRRSLRRYADEAVGIFIGKADERSVRPSKELNDWVDTFTRVWLEVRRSNFPRNYDRYLQRLEPAERSLRSEVILDLSGVNSHYFKALESRSAEDWAVVQEEAQKLVRKAEQAGDLFYLAFSLNIAGTAFNPQFNEHSADPELALRFYSRCLEAREKLDLRRDPFYRNVKETERAMRAVLGLPDPDAPKPAKPRDPIPPAEGAEWKSYGLEFEVDRDLEKVAHASDLADMNRMTWIRWAVDEPGTAAELPLFDPKVYLKRIDRNEYALDGGGGESRPFKLSVKPVTVEFERKLEDGTAVPCALMIAGGQERDLFNGWEFNVAPTDEFAIFYYRPVGVRTADTDYGEIRIYDLNGDGEFGYPMDRQPVGGWGFLEGWFLHRMDGVLLGKGRHSGPFSRWITDGKGRWFELQVDDYEKASVVQLREVAPETGRIQVKMQGLGRGVELVSCVLESDLSALAGLEFDPLMGRKGVLEVPVGRYKFKLGRLADKKKGGECLVIPPREQEITVEVEAGKTAVLELGKPFTLVVEHELKGRQLTLKGRTAHVAGAAGERYIRIVGAPLFGIEVFAKGGKSAVLEQPTIEEANEDWNRAFYPGDANLSLKSEELPPLRLVLKKHPWFGNLDTGWIE